MSHVVEHSNILFRDKDTNLAEVRAVGRFSSAEVREILTRSGCKDVRQLGCPDWIFEKLIEHRAKKLNFNPAPQPAPAPAPDVAERLAANRLF